MTDQERETLEENCCGNDWNTECFKEAAIKAGAENVQAFAGESDSFGIVTICVKGTFKGEEFDFLY